MTITEYIKHKNKVRGYGYYVIQCDYLKCKVYLTSDVKNSFIQPTYPKYVVPCIEDCWGNVMYFTNGITKARQFDYDNADDIATILNCSNLENVDNFVLVPVVWR